MGGRQYLVIATFKSEKKLYTQSMKSQKDHQGASGAQTALKKYMPDSLGWMLPVGLIIVTFVLLFFGISEQVGNLRTYSITIAGKVDSLTQRIERLEDEAGIVRENGATSAYTAKDSSHATEVKVSTQNIHLTGKEYVMVYFKAMNTTTGYDPVVQSGYQADGKNVYVMYYETTERDSDKETTAEVFELVEQIDSKTLVVDKEKYTDLLVMVNNDVLVYKNFNDSTEESMRAILTSLTQNDSVDTKIKDAAKKQLGS